MTRNVAASIYQRLLNRAHAEKQAQWLAFVRRHPSDHRENLGEGL